MIVKCCALLRVFIEFQALVETALAKLSNRSMRGVGTKVGTRLPSSRTPFVGYSEDETHSCVFKLQPCSLRPRIERELQLLADPPGLLASRWPEQIRGRHIQCRRDLLDVGNFRDCSPISPIRICVLVPNHRLPQIAVLPTLFNENLGDTIPEQIVQRCSSWLCLGQLG